MSQQQGKDKMNCSRLVALKIRKGLSGACYELDDVVKLTTPISDVSTKQLQEAIKQLEKLIEKYREGKNE